MGRIELENKKREEKGESKGRLPAAVLGFLVGLPFLHDSTWVFANLAGWQRIQGRRFRGLRETLITWPETKGKGATSTAFSFFFSKYLKHMTRSCLRSHAGSSMAK